MKEYGRFELSPGHIKDTHNLCIEDVHRSGEFWLTLSATSNKTDPIGHLRFKEIAPHIFELVEMRQAGGPLLIPEPRLVNYGENQNE